MRLRLWATKLRYHSTRLGEEHLQFMRLKKEKKTIIMGQWKIARAWRTWQWDNGFTRRYLKYYTHISKAPLVLNLVWEGGLRLKGPLDNVNSQMGWARSEMQKEEHMGWWSDHILHGMKDSPQLQWMSWSLMGLHSDLNQCRRYLNSLTMFLMATKKITLTLNWNADSVASTHQSYFD